jgi:hypothetical protein
VSSKSLRQSAGDEDNEENGDEEGDDPQESSHGSQGSGGLWDQVETFLNKPSPSFAALAKEAKSSSGSVLPTLRHGDRRPQPVAPPHGGNQSGGPRAARSSVRVATKQPPSGARALDPKLLQEAFAYAEKIQRVGFNDEDDEDDELHDQQREAERRSVGGLRRDASSGSGSGSGPRSMPLDKHGTGSSSSLRHKADDKPKKKTSAKTSAYGASVKPQLSKKKSVASERRPSVTTKDTGGWDASSPDAFNGDGLAHSRKGSTASMDQQTIQSLVSTLQNGTALDELRRELAASQQSLAMSRQVIQEAAKSFFRK